MCEVTLTPAFSPPPHLLLLFPTHTLSFPFKNRTKKERKKEVKEGKKERKLKVAFLERAKRKTTTKKKAGAKLISTFVILLYFQVLRFWKAIVAGQNVSK